MAQHYQERALPVTIVCPPHVVGPNDHSLWGYFLRLYLNRLMVPFNYSPEMMISPAHVNDVGEGIALAAERARPGETYILAGESMSLREVFAIWITQPGGLKVRFFIPRWLAALMFAPMEPLQRSAGLPAFV